MSKKDENEEEETEFVRVDSWMQSTVPSIPKFFAVICLFLNIFVPGLGTIIGGLMSCCCGRPRVDFKPAECRCPAATLAIAIGFGQLLSAGFFLVGWLWSIVWGFLMVNLSGPEFRKMKPPPAKPKPGEKTSPMAGQNMEQMPPGKRNFNRLILKAAGNKEQAEGKLVSINVKDGSGASGGTPAAFAPKSADGQATAKPGNSSEGPSHSGGQSEAAGPASDKPRSSLFGCFPKKLFKGKRSESLANLLETAEGSWKDSTNRHEHKNFNKSAEKMFKKWKKQALKAPGKQGPLSDLKGLPPSESSLDFVINVSPMRPCEGGAPRLSSSDRHSLMDSLQGVTLNPSALTPTDFKQPKMTHSPTYHYSA